MKERTDNCDKTISLPSFRAQLKAIHRWAVQAPSDLSVTAAGAAKATGMPIATATRALLGLESAGLARCNSEGDAWRPDITALDTLALPT